MKLLEGVKIWLKLCLWGVSCYTKLCLSLFRLFWTAAFGYSTYLRIVYIKNQVVHAILTINATRENMLNRANSECELCGIAGSAI